MQHMGWRLTGYLYMLWQQLTSTGTRRYLYDWMSADLQHIGHSNGRQVAPQ